MLFTVAVTLFAAWLLGFGVLEVTGGLIHLLLVLAVLSIGWQFIRGRRTTI